MSSAHQKVPSNQPSLWSRDGLFCMLLLACCLVPTWPILEMGINDDWCYTIIAWGFGHTGHLIFHGWASPIFGWQALWGGLAARLFGFTYTVVRLSAWPIAFATVLLLHSILRRFGLNRSHAIFGTLTFTLSPLFLPLADTFMTDVPCLFVLFLCLYLCQSALAASTDRQAILWLTAAALSNVVFGTVRQIAWLGVLVIVPCCGFLLRKRQNLLAITIVLWLFSALCIALTLHWFKYQPYTAPEGIIPRDLDAKALLKVLTNFWQSALTIPLLCLPVLASSLGAVRKLPKSLQNFVAALSTLLGLCFMWRPGRRWLLPLTPPWMGNTLTRHGIMQGGLLFSASRSIASTWLLLTLMLFLLSAFVFAALSVTERPVAEDTSRTGTTVDTFQVCILLLPFAIVYSLVLFPRAAQFVIFDRYLLELIAVALIFLLRLHQSRIAPNFPAVAYGVLALFAVVAVAGTHDLFAMERARLALLGQLEQKGIQRTAVRAGFELDAVTQIDAWGYINDPRILVPRDAFHPQPSQTIPPLYPECVYLLQEFFPVVHPQYLLASDDSPCTTGQRIATSSYRTWLPLATRSLVAGAPRYP